MNTSHVTSLELSRKLHEAGLTKESEFYWYKEDEEHPWVLQYCWDDGGHDEQYPVLLASEVLELLPESINTEPCVGWLYVEKQKPPNTWSICYKQINDKGENVYSSGLIFEHESLAECAGLLLLELSTQGLIEKK